MKKILAILLLCACLASVLSGCHGKRAEETDGLSHTAYTVPSGFDTEKPYTVTFWAKNDTNKTQVDIYNKAMRDFEALYPNIDVQVRWYTDYGRIYGDVITNIATGTTPNVCITYPDHIATYITGENVVVPLDGLMADEKFGLGGSELRFDGPARDEVVDKFLVEGRIDGRQYALPFMRSTEVCYVNTTFLERLGYTLPDTLTWDFIWEVSEAAMEKNADGTFAVNGQRTMIPFLYKSTDNMMIQYLRQSGADYATESGEIGLFNDTTEQFLYTVATHAETRAFSTFKISSYPANFLNAGQCIFAIDSTAGATWMGSDAPNVDIAEENLVDFETEVCLLPQVDPTQPLMISQGPSVCVFYREDAGEVLASWLFAQFLLTNEVQLAYAATEGYLPVTEKALSSAEYQDYLSRAGEDNDLYYDVKLDATKILLENIENTFVTPVFNGSASLRDAAGQLIESTVRQARRGEPMTSAAMRRLMREVSALYRLDQLSERVEGPLPAGAIWFLGSLCTLWVGIGGFSLWDFIKKRKKS